MRSSAASGLLPDVTTLDGSKSLTGAELFGLFAKGGDALRQEDLAAAEQGSR